MQNSKKNFPKQAIFALGIDDYSEEVANLAFSAKSAFDFFNCMTNPQIGSCDINSSVCYMITQNRKLPDHQGNVHKVEAKDIDDKRIVIDWLEQFEKKACKAGVSQLIYYFNGHSEVSPFRNNHGVTPLHFKLPYAKNLHHSLDLYQRIISYYPDIIPAASLYIIDSCSSGTLFHQGFTSGQRENKPKTLMVACEDNSDTWQDDDLESSVYTYYLIENLQNWQETSSNITALALQRATISDLNAWRRDNGYPLITSSLIEYRHKGMEYDNTSPPPIIAKNHNYKQHDEYTGSIIEEDGFLAEIIPQNYSYISRITDEILSSQYQNYLWVGEALIGKTTLLKQIQESLHEEHPKLRIPISNLRKHITQQKWTPQKDIASLILNDLFGICSRKNYVYKDSEEQNFFNIDNAAISELAKEIHDYERDHFCIIDSAEVLSEEEATQLQLLLNSIQKEFALKGWYEFSYLISTRRKELYWDNPYKSMKSTQYHSIPGLSLQEIESFLTSQFLLTSIKDIHRTKILWTILKGSYRLPPLVHKSINWIRQNEQLFIERYNMTSSNEEEEEEVDILLYHLQKVQQSQEYAHDYVNELLSKDNLLPLGDYAVNLQDEVEKLASFIKNTCVYRRLFKNFIYVDINLSKESGIENIWKELGMSCLFTNPSMHPLEYFPSTREILFNYNYLTSFTFPFPLERGGFCLFQHGVKRDECQQKRCAELLWQVSASQEKVQYHNEKVRCPTVGNARAEKLIN